MTFTNDLPPPHTPCQAPSAAKRRAAVRPMQFASSLAGVRPRDDTVAVVRSRHDEACERTASMLQLVLEHGFEMFHLGTHDVLTVRRVTVLVEVILVVILRLEECREGRNFRDDRLVPRAGSVQFLLVFLRERTLHVVV